MFYCTVFIEKQYYKTSATVSEFRISSFVTTLFQTVSAAIQAYDYIGEVSYIVQLITDIYELYTGVSHAKDISRLCF